MSRELVNRQLLPKELCEFLRRTNPWWEGNPGPATPSYRRWAFRMALRKLEAGLAPAVVLRGPRQVGKTTLQLQVIEHLIRDKGIDPRRILRVQFDECPQLRGLTAPVMQIPWWFQDHILGRSFNDAARAGAPAFLFFDEVQGIAKWAPQLKALVDHHTIKAFVTGSSALRIEAGRDSLAGRITTMDLGTLLLREILALRFQEELEPHMPANGLEPLLHADFWRSLQDAGRSRSAARDRGFAEFSLRGGYPVAHAHPDVPWPELADQLNETVIQRAIQHDMLKRRRRDQELLLEEVFRLACRYAGQSPGPALFVPDIRTALGADVSYARILSYLGRFDAAMLLRLVPPLELRLKRRASGGKLCLCDHALRASRLQEIVPLHAAGLQQAPHLSDLAGHIAESVVGYFFGGIPHLDVAHFPERGIEPEVDFILTIGEHRIPLEVKFRQHIDPHRDTRGLRSFLEKTVYNAPFGVLVTMADDVAVPDPRIVAVSLPSLLLLR
ncbi:MAG: hypothetical protein FJ291_21525 [Planctomycetes bacterium]|nr:hypothetical protein [Planctomycetota bacterium]